MRGGARKGAGRTPGVKNKRSTGHIARFRVLNTAEEKAYWRKVLQLAEDKGNVDALIRALTQIAEMHRGRPYVAKNPDEAKGNALAGDTRLQEALKTLLPGSKPDPQPISKPSAKEPQPIVSQAERQGESDYDKHKPN